MPSMPLGSKIRTSEIVMQRRGRLRNRCRSRHYRWHRNDTGRIGLLRADVVPPQPPGKAAVASASGTPGSNPQVNGSDLTPRPLSRVALRKRSSPRLNL